MKIFIAGLGSIGLRHLQNVLEADQGKHEAYVWDPDEKQRTMVANKHPKLTFAEKPDGIKIDLALICTPNHTHVEWLKYFVSKGIPVFVEKPIVIKPIDELELLGSANSLVLVGANMHYHPAVAKAFDIVKSKQYGAPISASAYFGNHLDNWRVGKDRHSSYSSDKAQGGGVLWDTIHELSYLAKMFGSITEMSVMRGTQKILGINSDEHVEALMRHSGGVLSHLHTDYLQATRRRGLEIVFEQAVFEWSSIGKNPEEMHIRIVGNNGRAWEETIEQVDLNEMYKLQLNDVLQSAKEGRSVDWKLLDGKDAYRDAMCIYDYYEKEEGTTTE